MKTKTGQKRSSTIGFLRQSKIEHSFKTVGPVRDTAATNGKTESLEKPEED
jgi:hypothetical protein